MKTYSVSTDIYSKMNFIDSYQYKFVTESGLSQVVLVYTKIDTETPIYRANPTFRAIKQAGQHELLLSEF